MRGGNIPQAQPPSPSSSCTKAACVPSRGESVAAARKRKRERGRKKEKALPWITGKERRRGGRRRRQNGVC